MTLTPEQLSVVNLVSGRRLVLAPSGSRKTEMLSQRIVRVLGSGVDPKKMRRNSGRGETGARRLRCESVSSATR